MAQQLSCVSCFQLNMAGWPQKSDMTPFVFVDAVDCSTVARRKDCSSYVHTKFWHLKTTASATSSVHVTCLVSYLAALRYHLNHRLKKCWFCFQVLDEIGETDADAFNLSLEEEGLNDSVRTFSVTGMTVSLVEICFVIEPFPVLNLWSGALYLRWPRSAEAQIKLKSGIHSVFS